MTFCAKILVHLNFQDENISIFMKFAVPRKDLNNRENWRQTKSEESFRRSLISAIRVEFLSSFWQYRKTKQTIQENNMSFRVHQRT